MRRFTRHVHEEAPRYYTKLDTYWVSNTKYIHRINPKTKKEERIQLWHELVPLKGQAWKAEDENRYLTKWLHRLEERPALNYWDHIRTEKTKKEIQDLLNTIPVLTA